MISKEKIYKLALIFYYQKNSSIIYVILNRFKKGLSTNDLLDNLVFYHEKLKGYEWIQI